MNCIELNTLLSSLLMELFRDNEPNNVNGTLQGYDSQLVGGESHSWLSYERGEGFGN